MDDFQKITDISQSIHKKVLAKHKQIIQTGSFYQIQFFAN